MVILAHRAAPLFSASAQAIESCLSKLRLKVARSELLSIYDRSIYAAAYVYVRCLWCTRMCVGARSCVSLYFCTVCVCSVRVVSMRWETPICAPATRPFLRRFPTLSVKQSQCSSESNWQGGHLSAIHVKEDRRIRPVSPHWLSHWLAASVRTRDVLRGWDAISYELDLHYYWRSLLKIKNKCAQCVKNIILIILSQWFCFKMLGFWIQKKINGAFEKLNPWSCPVLSCWFC